MSIKGTKSATPHHHIDSEFSIHVVFFEPKYGSSRIQPVTTVDELQTILAPYQTHERLAIFLDRNNGDSGAVWVHLNGDRAWVTHFTEMGGVDSYAYDLGYNGPDDMIQFLLDNRQPDEIHRAWTISRVEGIHALEHFLQQGEKSPNLNWASEPESLQEPLKRRTKR